MESFVEEGWRSYEGLSICDKILLNSYHVVRSYPLDFEALNPLKMHSDTKCENRPKTQYKRVELCFKLFEIFARYLLMISSQMIVLLDKQSVKSFSKT